MAEKEPLGFDAVVAEPDEEQTGYTVEFASTEPPEKKPEASGSEEIGLLDRHHSASPEEKKLKEQTVFFNDGQRRIDFVLTYRDDALCKKDDDEVDGEASEKLEVDEKQIKRRDKRERFLQSCREVGLEFEEQDAEESPDRVTFYVKVHATHKALLKGADDLLLRMPIRENNLEVSSWRERFFDAIKVKDPFEPAIPEDLEITNFFTAPFKYERKENYIGWDKDTFFTTGQRSAIVWNIMLNARYGDDDDQIGLLRLMANACFNKNGSFPLHESTYKVNEKEGEEISTDRQLLYHRWSHPRNWYKKQPLDHIRRYFGEKVGIYFTWLGFYTTWLLPASIVGIIVLIVGLTTFFNPISTDTCDDANRYVFYMCPLCDARCDFWYLRDSCNFARVSLLFDNGATVFFAIFMAFWAVFFLEFWKRRQFYLQYDWDMLGYEAAEERARPQFEQRIKRYIKRCRDDKSKEKFYIYNPVLEKREYIQPQHWLVPKVTSGIVVLLMMVGVVIAVVFLVLLYRLAVAGAIYRALSNFTLIPGVGDIIVSITGACIQLVAIIILNKLYEYFATFLNKWELHRTQTDYDDSFIVKMYIFQFVNFYASLFYIAYIKGKPTIAGNPGDYSRIGGALRLDECATYGCLLELTIQLAIIMVGKQILNNGVEISLPYVKRLVNKIKHKEETDEDVYTRWEKDYDLIPLSDQGLFFEYLELIIQYGFITIFVAAFPLAPFFALLNNWFEIRLDAHKFVAVFRRPVPERAQDIGAWFGILSIVSQLAVVTNAFLIAFTAQLVPTEVYARSFRELDTGSRLAGYVNWSLSPFTVEKLLDGAFPTYAAMQLDLYDANDEVVQVGEDDVAYLPFVDFDCMTRMAEMNYTNFDVSMIRNVTVNVTGTLDDINNGSETVPFLASGVPLEYWRTFTTDFFEETNMRRENLSEILLDAEARDTSPETFGPCFVNTLTCRFRGLVEDGGFEEGNRANRISTLGVRYWQTVAAQLAFVVVFEHLIFIISFAIAAAVPDVPQSVKNEIQREKLLAYEAIHARPDVVSPPPPISAGDDDDPAVEVIIEDT